MDDTTFTLIDPTKTDHISTHMCRLESEQNPDCLPEDYRTRSTFIQAQTHLTEPERQLLQEYNILTENYKSEALADSEIRTHRINAHYNELTDRREQLKKSKLRYVLTVITFGIINPGNWNEYVDDHITASFDENRRREDLEYSNARRLVNQKFFQDELRIFTKGEMLLSNDGKALFNQLGDRREKRPRYLVDQKSVLLAPSPPTSSK